MAAHVNGIDCKAGLVAPAGKGMKEHYKSYLFDFEKVEAYDTYGNKLKIGPLRPT